MKNITYLQIEPTTNCNFNCSFCCGRSDEQKTMDLGTFKNVIDQLPHLKHVHIQGEGEPLLTPYIFDMIKYVKTKGIIATTITNGSLIYSNIDEILKSGIDKISISIESDIPSKFKQIRGGDLNIIKKGINELIRERNKRNAVRPAVGFEVLLMKDTLDRIKHIYRLYEDLGMDGGILLQPLCTRKHYMNNYSDSLKKQITSSDENTRALEQAQVLNREILINETVKNDIDLLQTKEPDERCSYLQKSIFVNVKNLVSFCCIIKEGGKNSLGMASEMEQVFKRRHEKLYLLETEGVFPDECFECMNDGFSSSIL